MDHDALVSRRCTASLLLFCTASLLLFKPFQGFVARVCRTLPSNLALCVHPDLVYIKIKEKESGTQYWLMEARTSQLYKDAEEFTVLEKCTGKDLKGKKCDRHIDADSFIEFTVCAIKV